MAEDQMQQVGGIVPPAQETIQPVGGKAFQMPVTTADRIAKSRAARARLDSDLTALAQQYEVAKQEDPLQAEQIYNQAAELADLIPEYDRVQDGLINEARSKLKDGSYLKETTDLSENGIAKAFSKNLSAVVGGEVDMQRSVDPDIRRNLAFMSGPTQDEYLAQKFGAENIKTENVGGEAIRLVRQQDGKWVPTNEMGATSSDMWVVPGEAFPMLTSLVGNAIGAAVFKNPSGTAAAGALGYGFGGSLQDAFVKQIFKVGPGFVESIPERVSEGAMGGVMEYGLVKAAMPSVRAISTAIKGKESKVFQRMRAAENVLDEQGYPIRFARLSKGSDADIEYRLAAAERLPNSQLGRDVIVDRQKLDAIKDAMISGSSPSQAARNVAVDVLKNERDEASRLVGFYNKKAADAMQSGYNERVLQAQTRSGMDIPQAGKYLWQELKSAETRANNIKTEVYIPFYERANPKVSVDPIELAETIEKQYYSSPVRSAEMDRALEELRSRPQNAKRITEIDKQLLTNPSPEVASALSVERRKLEKLAGPLNAQQLDNYVQIFSDAAPDQVVGASTKKRVAGNASDVVQSFRDDIYRKNGLYNDWAQARAVYQNRMGFQQQQLGSIMKNTFGRSDLTESQIINKTLSDPRTLNDVLSAVQIGDPGRLPQVRSSLQSAYLEKIGLANRNGRSIKDFDFDDNIMKSLYGDDLQGRLVAKRLRDLRGKVKEYGVDASKITIDDVNELGKYYSDKTANALRDNIVKRIQAEQQLEKVQNEALLKIAEKGHTEAITREMFASALWKTDPKRITKIMAKYGPDDQEAIRGDFAEYFFQRYHQSTEIGDNLLPWNGRQFLDDIAKDKQILHNMRKVLGDKKTDTLVAASQAMLVLERKAAQTRGVSAGMVLTEKQQKAYLQARPIFDAFGHRIVAAQYKMGNLMPILSRVLGGKELTQEQWNKTMFYGLLSTAASEKGLEAMLGVGRFDPEWSAYVGQNLGIMQAGEMLGMGNAMREGIKYREEKGKER